MAEIDLELYKLRNKVTNLQREIRELRSKPRPSIRATDIPAALQTQAERLCEMQEFAYPTCVYFLMLDGDVVYVGQTVNLAHRIQDHRRWVAFDRVLFLPTAPLNMDIDMTESAFIRLLKPQENRSRGLKDLPPSVFAALGLEPQPYGEKRELQ